MITDYRAAPAFVSCLLTLREHGSRTVSRLELSGYDTSRVALNALSLTGKVRATKQH